LASKVIAQTGADRWKVVTGLALAAGVAAAALGDDRAAGALGTGEVRATSVANRMTKTETMAVPPPIDPATLTRPLVGRYAVARA
jgi:hypothetical protein